jgi:carbon starvation protein
MDARSVVLATIALLGAGYFLYGRFVSRRLGVDPARPTPAHTRYDGVDYVPARHWLVLFGHHFSSICAAGPIVGPALAVAYWGALPSLFWILVGGIFMGAVADFSSLVVAVRHGGVSISEVAGTVLGRRARTLFSLFILISLILVLAVFSELTAGTFVSAPEIVLPSWGILPVAIGTGLLLYRGPEASRKKLVAVTGFGLALLVALMEAGRLLPIALADLGPVRAETVWVALLLVYCSVASVAPVQYLLQPRDYLSSYVLFATIAIGIVGAVWTAPPLSAEPYHGFLPSDWPLAGPLWPMMFVTIACGAISGFHSVVSSGTTCKQLSSEADACRIGYGAMLVESLVAVLVVVSVGAGLSAARHAELLRSPGGAIQAFGEGYGALTRWLFGGYGTAFAIMALNFFILTTLDTATRLARYLVEELTGWRNRFGSTLAVVLLTAALVLTGQWRAIWPAFGASNQLVGALALLVTSCWLLARGRGALPTAIPSVLLLITTVGAFFWQVESALFATEPGTGAWRPDWLMAAIGILLVALAVSVFLEAWRAFRTPRREVVEPT